jgi:hypothetical protein
MYFCCNIRKMIKGKFGMLSPMWKIMLKGKQQLTTEK